MGGCSGTVLGRGDYTTLIINEDFVLAVYSNINGLFSEARQVFGGAAISPSIRRNKRNALGGVVSAGTFFTGVGVIRLLHSLIAL